jgi:hypothetical protein
MWYNRDCAEDNVHKHETIFISGGRATMLKITNLINYPEIKRSPVCFNCGSKLYPGDTVYIIDRENYCEECVEVTEFETVLD